MVIIILKNITLQRGLYCLAFLAFGIGDGMVMFKLWITFMMLLAIYVKSYSNGYWTVNGVLFAIIAGGFMGIYSNMSVINGAVPPEPGGILLILLANIEALGVL
ncbi:hypothetical protein [Candidatus Methanoperedens nitratireducens]|uniref:hypothetical protein n=1 Tax=Candidatus Methanoperedens nitratireducens TaxID=1392998 RepID=UPI000BB899F4|nr:hypothetical protein [Candidatus Methanoperedens nitroreducens]